MDDQLLLQIVAAQAAQAEILKSIDTKLSHCIVTLEGSSEHPGVVIRVDRLEQSETRRSRMVWVLFGGFATLFFNAVATHLGWK